MSGLVDVYVNYRRDVPAEARPGFTKSGKLSWIVFKSRKDRDRVNAKVMKDPWLKSMMDPKKMPFDAQRMIYAGAARVCVTEAFTR